MRMVVGVAVAAAMGWGAAGASGQITSCVGTYSGTWRNLTFSTTGPLTAVVSLNGTTLSISFDADGGVFGGNNPPAALIAGPVAGGNWTGTLLNDPVYGNLTASYTMGTNAVVANGTNVPSPFVASYSATGTLTACSLHLNGTIVLEPAGTAMTVIDAARVCYANCDGSTGAQVLNVNDFVCFQSRFAAGAAYADCDQSGALNVNDFVCFQGRFAAGCP